MCKLLGEKEKTNESKNKQLKNWKNFFSYEKIGREFVIYKIYSYDEVENNLFKTLLEDKLAYSICVLLQFYKIATDANIMIISNNKLAQSIGLINDNFIKYRIYSLDSNDKVKEKLKMFEDDLAHNDFALLSNMPQLYKNKYIKEISNRDKNQLNKAIDHIIDSKKEKDKIVKNKKHNIKSQNNKNIDSDNDFFDEEIEEEYYINKNFQLISSFIDGDTTKISPTHSTQKILLDFYSHLGENLKYKLDTTFKKLEANSIMIRNKWFIGMIFKDEDQLAKDYTDKGLEIPDDFVREQENNKQILLSEQLFNKIIDRFDKEFKKDKLTFFNTLNSPDVFIRNKANKILKEEFNLDFVYFTNILIFSENGVEKFQNNFKQQITQYLKSINKINRLLIANSTDFQLQVLENYKNRDINIKTTSDLNKKTSDSLFAVLTNEFLKVLDETSVQWEKTNINIPAIWDKSFHTSNNLNSTRDLTTNYRDLNYSTSRDNENISNSKIEEKNFE